MKGFFISFEGIDGSGKSTQAKRLCKYIESLGKECVLVREPGGTPEGERIRRILLDKSSDLTPEAEFFLFLASRSILTQRIIIPSLKLGKFVIADRFADSSLAYQGYGRGLDISFVKYGNNVATKGLKPDVIFYIDIPVELAMRRKSYSDRMEKESFLKKVREGYLKLSKEHGYIPIDGRKSVEEIWDDIKGFFSKMLEVNGIDRDNV